MQVKADEQAAVAAAAQAQAQAEAQAELHRQLQQRLADAQAASVAQEAEKEKRRAQPVTLKGARLAFTAPKAPGKAAATEQSGNMLNCFVLTVAILQNPFSNKLRADG